MNAYHGTTGSYVAGFLGSLVCTLAAYTLVVGHVGASPAFVLAVVVALAIFQFGVQVVLFLHLGRNAGLWTVVTFIFAGVIIGIVVTGSLWIMFNLNSRMMPSESDMMQYMQNQDTM